MVKTISLLAPLTAAIHLSAAVWAQDVPAPVSEIELRPEQKLFVVLSEGPNGDLLLNATETEPAAAPFVSLKFIKDGATRMLSVRNGYDKTLHYKARICSSKRKRCADTSIIPVRPGISGYDHGATQSILSSSRTLNF